MVFFRLYLALIVVHAHAGNLFGWPVQNGAQAVQMFFMISGFYMAMVLSERYGSVKEFYLSRWLRISVPYYLHLILFVLISAVCGLIFSNWRSLDAYMTDPLAHNGLIGILFAGLANVTIFGQDLTLFLSDPVGRGLSFTAHFTQDQYPLYRYLIIPQCWSVALELTFYALAPFINRLRALYLLFLVLVGLATRVVIYSVFGLQNDPWYYRFFPNELGLFCLGMLTWRLYSNRLTFWPRVTRLHPTIYGAVIMVVLGVSYGATFVHWELSRHVGGNFASLGLFCMVPFLIVGLFSLTRSSKIDRFIGELSYLVYLNHLFIIELLRSAPADGFIHRNLGILAGVLSVLFAAVCWVFIFRPFERWRHDIVIRRTSETAVVI